MQINTRASKPFSSCEERAEQDLDLALSTYEEAKNIFKACSC